MATVPEGATVFPSPAGWAPLVRAELDGCSIFLLPGPPSEVQAIFARYLADHFGGDRGGRSVVHRVYVDMWESEVSPLLQRVMGSEVALIDSAQETAAELARVLRDERLAAVNGRPRHRFVVSDDPDRFRQVGARLIGERLADAEVVPMG